MEEPVARMAKIIIDEPATSDAFDGGGHQRVAVALADAIEQLSDRDGAIGLEGQWGAGKSTVINLASKVLEDREVQEHQFSLFTFDLWAHQSDDFRRAFLEEFVAWLEDRRYLSEKIATDAKNKIRDRVREIRVENLKRYNLFGVLFLVIAPVLPLAYAWLSPFGFNLHLENEGWPELVRNTIINGIIVIYALFAIRFLYHLVIIPIFKSTQISVSGAASRAISMFSRDVENETTTQNIRETDPTTIEFHNIFRELLSKVQRGNRRIVLVLDNIDRLPNSSVTEVWSEVRSLFAVGRPASRTDHAYVTAVVPYDRPFIVEAAFAVNNDTANTEKKSKKTVEGDVLTKTFNRVLRVSPPIATDWRKFLNESLDFALAPHVDENSKDKLFRIFRYYLQQDQSNASPRRIINFVNEIGVLWTQWGNIIPIETLGLYVLFRQSIEDDSGALLDLELLDSRYTHILDRSDWRRDFAALTFNVNPERANQLLIGPAVSAALTASNSDAVLQLSKVEGFDEILPDLLASDLQDWTGAGPKTISNIATNIDRIQLVGELARSIWRALIGGLTGLQKIELLTLQECDGLFLIVERQESVRVLSTATTLRKKLSHSVTVGSDTSDEKGGDDSSRAYEEGWAWFKGIHRIFSIIKEKSGTEAATKFIKQARVPRNADFCIGVAEECAVTEDVAFIDLNVDIPREQIHKAFGRFILDSPQEFWATLAEIDPVLDESARVKYLQEIGDRLRSTEVKDEDDRVALLESFSHLYSKVPGNSGAGNQLTQLVNDGTLLWQGHSLEQSRNSAASAVAQWLIIINRNGSSLPTVPDQHPQLGAMNAARDWYSESFLSNEVDSEKVNKLAHWVSEYDQFTSWVGYAIEESPENDFFKLVLKVVVSDSTFKKLNVFKTICDYPAIKSIVGPQAANGFLRKFSDWGTRFDDLSPDQVLQMPDEFIKDVCDLESKQNLNRVLIVIDNYLKQLSQEEWEEALELEDDRLRLLLVRRKTGNLTLPVDAFRPALLSHALQVLEGGTTPSTYASQWDEVEQGLKPATRKALANDIFNKLPSVTVTTEGAERLVEFYQSVVMDMPFTENPDKALIHFLSKMVFSTTQASRLFLKQRARDIKRCLSAASQSAQSNFEEAVQSLEEKQDDASQEWAGELRKRFGLKQKKAQNAEDKEEKKE